MIKGSRSKEYTHKSSRRPREQRDTSWQGVAGRYHKSVGQGGNYYHQHVVIPGVVRMLNLRKDDSLLDLGCGQGVLARAVKQEIDYVGIDLAPDLIRFAAEQNRNPRFKFQVDDITLPMKVGKKDFTHAAIVLALQNVEDYAAVIANAAKYLQPGGKFVIVINHPAFRIPRQTGWGIDEQSKLQYRRVNVYMNPLKVPIDMEPGSRGGERKLTWSFHNPLSAYAQALAKSGFVIAGIEEWVSDKESEGRAKRMENRSRAEIPLFMALLCQRQ